MIDTVSHEPPQFSLPAKPKADGSYAATIKTPSGKWRDVRIPLSVATAPNYKAAEKFVLKHLGELAAGAKPRDLAAHPTSGHGIRIRDLAPKVLAFREAEKSLAEATRAEFRSNVNTHLVPRFGDRFAHELGPKDFNAFVDELVAKGREPLTVRTIFKNFGTFFQIALARELDSELSRVGNPLRLAYEDKRVKMPTPKAKPIVYVPQADAEKLLACADVPEHRRVRYFIAFLAGLRDGEVAGLTWADVSLDAEIPILTLRTAVALPRKKNNGPLEKGALKTEDSKRKIPIHSQLLPVLRTWKLEGWKRWAGYKPRETDFVLPNHDGTAGRPRSAEHLRADLAAIGCATDVEGEPVDFHATRRSFSTWLEELGVYPETVDRLLGHKLASVRGQHYSAATLRPMREAIERLRLNLGSSSTPTPPTGSPKDQGEEQNIGKPAPASESSSETTPDRPILSDAAGRTSDRFAREKGSEVLDASVGASGCVDPSLFPKPKVARPIRAGGASTYASFSDVPMGPPSENSSETSDAFSWADRARLLRALASMAAALEALDGGDGAGCRAELVAALTGR